MKKHYLTGSISLGDGGTAGIVLGCIDVIGAHLTQVWITTSSPGSGSEFIWPDGYKIGPN